MKHAEPQVSRTHRTSDRNFSELTNRPAQPHHRTMFKNRVAGGIVREAWQNLNHSLSAYKVHFPNDQVTA